MTRADADFDGWGLVDWRWDRVELIPGKAVWDEAALRQYVRERCAA